MGIRVMSRAEMSQEVIANSGKLAVIMIMEPNESLEREEPLKYKESRRELTRVTQNAIPHLGPNLTLVFWDLNKPLAAYTELATTEDVLKALQFSMDHEDLIVACAAGISRSSALAYVIARTRMPKEEALKILSPDLHWPNRHVLKIGEEIIGYPVLDEINKAGFYGEFRS